jgi:hypothetical protein
MEYTSKRESSTEPKPQYLKVYQVDKLGLDTHNSTGLRLSVFEPRNLHLNNIQVVE